jgi:hypothetical protein
MQLIFLMFRPEFNSILLQKFSLLILVKINSHFILSKSKYSLYTELFKQMLWYHHSKFNIRKTMCLLQQ